MVAAVDFSFYISSVSAACPSSPNLTRSWSYANAQVVRRYFCSCLCWLFPGASTGTLSWLEGTLQALYRMRKRTRRRTATRTLHTIATTAAVDSPTPLSLDSMLKKIAEVLELEWDHVEVLSSSNPCEKITTNRVALFLCHPALSSGSVLPSLSGNELCPSFIPSHQFKRVTRLMHSSREHAAEGILN